MSGSVTKDGRMRCSFARDGHAQWPRIEPCNKLAVAKYHQGGYVFAYYCEAHAESVINQDHLVVRSSKGFFVKDGKGLLFEILPIYEDKQPQIIRGMGCAIQRIAWSDELYPESLKSYTNAPSLLSCLGDISLLNTPSLAIVGMQQPTELGRRIAYRIAAFFAQAGYTIISGLKGDIDIAAHQGALSVGGRTIAVVESPIGNVYPKQNRDLGQAIVQRKGLLLTSYYKTQEPIPSIAKPIYLQVPLSLAVIPIQSGIKGRTLMICRNAQILGRGLWIPYPLERDERENPECYVGIRTLLKWKDVVSFVGKEDYPMLLEILQSAK